MFNTAPRWCAKGALWATLTAGLLTSRPATAQVSLYQFQSVGGSYQPLTTGATGFTINGGAGTADDGYSSPITLPFGFPFNGSSYTSVIVNSNGFLGLGGTANTPNFNIDMFPNAAAAYDQTIAFAGIDMANAATVYRWRVDGSAPNRIWKLEAGNFDRFNAPGQTGSAQVWLYESGQIDLVYGTFSSLWNNTDLSFEAGLRGNGNTDLLTVGGTWAAPVASNTAATITTSPTSIPTPGQTFRFTLPAGTDLTPPTIGAVTVTPPAPSCTAQAHTVSVTPTDASGIASATISYSVSGSAAQTVPMTNNAGTWSGTIPAQSSNAVTYTVTVTDASAQANASTTTPATYADALTTVDAGPDVTIGTGQTATLTAAAPTPQALKISEVSLLRTGTGVTTPLPAYISAGDDDFVEIANTSNGALSLASYRLEVRSSTASGVRTYTFPAAVMLPGKSVLVLHLGPGTDDFTNRYFHTGGTNDAFFSGNDVGLILYSPTNDVLDAVALNGYTFSSTVTAADWSTPPAIGSTSGAAGAGLLGADLNNGTNWQVATAAAPQTLGAYNAGLADAPLPTSVLWTGGVLTAPSTANPLTTPAHPTPGTYTYSVAYTANGCVVTDQVVVTVITPNAPVADFTASSTTPNVGQTVTFTDLSTNLPGTWQWTFSPNTVTFVNGTSATSRNPEVTFDAAGCYQVALTVTNSAGSDDEVKGSYVCAALSYCTTNLQQNACTSFGNFINSVSISSSALNNPNTGCNSANGNSYVVWPAGGATTADLDMGVTYTLTVTTNSVGSTGAWIDYNANGQFETTEFILVQDSGPANQPASVPFTVPMNGVPNTDVRLRIRNAGLANAIGAGDACVLRFSGETEDYVVRLRAILGTGAEAAAAGFTLAPNPTTDGLLTAQLPTGTTSLRVLDATGRVVRMLTTGGSSAALDLRALPTGLYLVQATTPSGVRTQRLVRE